MEKHILLELLVLINIRIPYQKYKLLINKSKEALLEIRELPEKSIQSEIVEQQNNLITLLQSYNKMIDEEPVQEPVQE